MKSENTSMRLKKIMSDRNLRQIDILELCKPYCQKYQIKLGRNDLSQYVSGKVEPGQRKLTILGLALNVSEAWLMGFDVPMERDSYNKQWDKEAAQFSDSINSFYMELNSLGWSCEWIDSDTKYLLSNGNVSFKISSDEYSNFIEDVNNFYKTRLEKLYEKSKVSLFPSDELATATQYQQPTTLAAHHEGTEYTEDELKELTSLRRWQKTKGNNWQICQNVH